MYLMVLQMEPKVLPMDLKMDLQVCLLNLFKGLKNQDFLAFY